MWPISPAAPRPVQRLPSRISPPPTPVPQKTPRIESYGLPAPSLNSAFVATSTSLPTRTCAPSASDSVGAEREGPVPVRAGCGPRRRRRSSRWCRPGEPTPTPASESVCTPAASAASTSALAISAATSAGPPSVGVWRRASPLTSPVGLDDRRLDLRPAEVDAAAERVLCRRRRASRASLFRPFRSGKSLVFAIPWIVISGVPPMSPATRSPKPAMLGAPKCVPSASADSHSSTRRTHPGRRRRC